MSRAEELLRVNLTSITDDEDCCIFGIGGGSDFNSACLIAKVLRALKPDRNIVIITAYAPLLDLASPTTEFSSTMNDETKLKYTGRRYSRFEKNGMTWELRETDAISQYSSSNMVSFHPDVPVFQDHRFTSQPDISCFGLLVPPPDMTKLFSDTLDALQAILTREFGEDANIACIAVDSGGDSLRGIVPGMGDVDISHLYAGVSDSRDRDALRIISMAGLIPKTKLIVFGPGSDGETSAAGLALANDYWATNSDYLIGKGHLSEFEPYWRDHESDEALKAWVNPSVGSTISNMMTACSSEDGNAEISINRRGICVAKLPIQFPSSYWIIDINYLYASPS